MKVTVINPNSSRAMTSITAVACAAAEPGIDLIVAENRRAPLSIEGYTDGIEAAAALVNMIREMPERGRDGYVIACFDNTGVDSLRAILSVPVLGIGEAAMHFPSERNKRNSP